MVYCKGYNDPPASQRAAVSSSASCGMDGVMLGRSVINCMKEIDKSELLLLWSGLLLEHSQLCVCEGGTSERQHILYSGPRHTVQHLLCTYAACWACHARKLGHLR